jgi:hypothetical protein
MQTARRRRGWLAALGALVVAVTASACLPPSAPTPSAAPQSSLPPATTPTTTAPVPSARDLAEWPFSSTSPWNTPLGSGATYDTRAMVTLPATTPWINRGQYSVPVVRAAATDPLVTINVKAGSHPGPVTLRIPADAAPAAGSDAHLVVISPDGTRSSEFWTLRLASNTAGAYLPADLSGPGVGLGWVRATGVSLLGGLIRAGELTNIRHALAISLPYTVLGPGHVWPAISDDDGGAPGFTPEGSLLAIPAGTPRPAGLSPMGGAIFDALSRYGAYVVDQSGAGAATLYAEPAADAAVVSAALPDMRSVLPLLRRVTNNTPSTVGGPGTRLAPLAP